VVKKFDQGGAMIRASSRATAVMAAADAFRDFVPAVEVGDLVQFELYQHPDGRYTARDVARHRPDIAAGEGERRTGRVIALRRIREDDTGRELKFVPCGVRPGDRVSFIPFEGAENWLAADVTPA
jgi:co-chaperonin GroES (HSP10)